MDSCASHNSISAPQVIKFSNSIEKSCFWPSETIEVQLVILQQFLTKLCIYHLNFLMMQCMLLNFGLLPHWIMLQFWECYSYINLTPALISRPILSYDSIPNLPLFYMLLFLQQLWINLNNLLLLQFANKHSLLKLCKPVIPRLRPFLFIWNLLLHHLYVFSVGLITLQSPN